MKHIGDCSYNVGAATKAEKEDLIVGPLKFAADVLGDVLDLLVYRGSRLAFEDSAPVGDGLVVTDCLVDTPIDAIVASPRSDQAFYPEDVARIGEAWTVSIKTARNRGDLPNVPFSSNSDPSTQMTRRLRIFSAMIPPCLQPLGGLYSFHVGATTPGLVVIGDRLFLEPTISMCLEDDCSGQSMTFCDIERRE